MMITAELSFGQEVWKEIIGGVATAILVTVVGGVIVDSWAKRTERRRYDHDLRNGLLDRCIRTAATMFIACQNVRRELRNAGADKKAEVLINLDAAYMLFSVEHTVLEQELGSHYGFECMSKDGPGGDAANRFVMDRWHQIADLLTVYYFNLKEDFPGDILQNNSVGHGGRFHSGIKLARPRNDKDSKDMRVEIRRAYNPAMKGLSLAILAAPFADPQS